ncbi:MAG: 30S ribosomal protein S20, partial [Planctomycetota bacterium]
MPNNRNAEKALRQNLKRRIANRGQRTALRSVVKKVRVALADSTPDLAVTEASLKEAIKKLDQAAAKGLIHKNAAARTKSRLVGQKKKKFDAPQA